MMIIIINSDGPIIIRLFLWVYKVPYFVIITRIIYISKTLAILPILLLA